MSLTDEEQAERRQWSRARWETGVPFNRYCRLRVTRWDPEEVVLYLPFRDELSAHEEIFHGGVLAALIDTCGSGAVMAGHDFTKGSRSTTISMSVQYLSAVRGEDVVASGVCTRRGRSVHFADVVVSGAHSGEEVARGHVAVNIAGERADTPWNPAG